MGFARSVKSAVVAAHCWPPCRPAPRSARSASQPRYDLLPPARRWWAGRIAVCARALRCVEEQSVLQLCRASVVAAAVRAPMAAPTAAPAGPEDTVDSSPIPQPPLNEDRQRIPLRSAPVRAAWARARPRGALSPRPTGPAGAHLGGSPPSSPRSRPQPGGSAAADRGRPPRRRRHPRSSPPPPSAPPSAREGPAILKDAAAADRSSKGEAKQRHRRRA